MTGAGLHFNWNTVCGGEGEVNTAAFSVRGITAALGQTAPEGCFRLPPPSLPALHKVVYRSLQISVFMPQLPLWNHTGSISQPRCDLPKRLFHTVPAPTHEPYRNRGGLVLLTRDISVEINLSPPYSSCLLSCFHQTVFNCGWLIHRRTTSFPLFLPFFCVFYFWKSCECALQILARIDAFSQSSRSINNPLARDQNVSPVASPWASCCQRKWVFVNGTKCVLQSYLRA